MQAAICDYRVCEDRNLVAPARMAKKVTMRAIDRDIFERLDGLGLKQRHLAEALGLEQNKISKVNICDRHFTSEEVLKARDWLAKMESQEAPMPRPSVRTEVESGDTVEIIALDLSLSMGPGTIIEDYPEEERVRISLPFVQAITRTPSDRLRLVRGIGDSMEPTLRSGDRVLVDLNEQQLARAHGVYWIDHLGTHGIKRLRPAGRGRVLVMSDNPLVPDFEVPAEELRIEGRVIWFARDL